ncbi:hypothetical protein OC846_006716 [Tilletia horrida]|uniref:Uncharacterized protein n=1 Tax=Tilletia horrida TaxID=155126 RepID=A0AAN6GL43_9BASI|nr:hypothetical protein OC846_006716 [Tilletia horrida]
MKDITLEDVRYGDRGVQYFTDLAGPGPRLSTHLNRAVDTTPPAVPLPLVSYSVWPWYLFRAVIDFCPPSSLPSSLRDSILTLKRLIRKDLPLQPWVDRVGSVKLLDFDQPDPTIVIFSFDPSVVKYDPALAKLRTRLLFLTLLTRRMAELLARRILKPVDIKARIEGFDPLQMELHQVRVELKELQSALFGLRGERLTAQSSEVSASRSLVSFSITQAAYARHAKAEGVPRSERRLAQWDTYAAAAPRQYGANMRRVISKASAKLPCPPSLDPFSPEHRDWVLTRKQGTDLAAAAGQYDAIRRDPDLVDLTFDEEADFTMRSAAGRRQVQERKLVVSPVFLWKAVEAIFDSKGDTIYTCTCNACGLQCLGNKNTQHRCTPQGAATFVSALDYVSRDMVLVSSKISDVLGADVFDEQSDTRSKPSISQMSWPASNCGLHFSTRQSAEYLAQMRQLQAVLDHRPTPILIAPAKASLPEDVKYWAIPWAYRKRLESKAILDGRL